MRRLVPAVVFLACSAAVAAEPAADGWADLLTPDGAAWKRVDPRWVKAADATLDPANPRRLKAKGTEGTVWVNGETGRLPDLVTKQSYKDVEVHVEFLLGKNSNSGIKFHALYEIQFRDTAGNKGELTGDHCGGIYPRATDKGGYKHIDKGVPPKVNAAKPAGEWQTLDVTFTSPRFDDKGEKTANAKVVKAVLNGQVIHDNVELKHPTGTNWVRKESPAGPFMLQADHGPVAFRNVRIRERKE
jgi:hypothetical protein